MKPTFADTRSEHGISLRPRGICGGVLVCATQQPSRAFKPGLVVRGAWVLVTPGRPVHVINPLGGETRYFVDWLFEETNSDRHRQESRQARLWNY